MKRPSLFGVLMILLFLDPLGSQEPTGQTIALTNVTVIDGTGGDPKSQMVVLIEGERIGSLFRAGTRPLPPSATVMDFSGHYVLPGLVNTHVHLTRLDQAGGRAHVERELRRMLYGGVTSIRDMNGDSRLLGSVERDLALGRIVGPEVYYAALVAGPDFMAKDPRVARASVGYRPGEAPWQLLVTPDTDPQGAVARASGTGAKGLKYYVGIDGSVMKAMSEAAHRMGLQVWAHGTVFPDRPMEVLRANVDAVSHVGWLAWEDRDLEPSRNVPYTHTPRADPIPRFDPAVVQADSPEMMALFAEMAQRGTVLDATYSAVVVRARGGSVGTTPRLAADPLVAVWRSLAIAARRSGVLISTGTDYFTDQSEPFPSVFSEIEHLAADVLSPAEAITAATLNGARAIGIEDTHGTIEPGKFADLVVLTDDPTQNIRALRSIVTVIKKGRLYSRSEYEGASGDTVREMTSP